MISFTRPGCRDGGGGSPSFCLSTSAGGEIHYSGPVGGQDQQLGVLVFGFAGSSINQLLKHSALYNSLGYRTLSCVLPHQLMFCYKIPEIVEFSRRVLDAAVEQEMRSLVTHSISNNGATVYQHLLSSSSSYPGLEVRGAVFDSSPGPQETVPALT